VREKLMSRGREIACSFFIIVSLLLTSSAIALDYAEKRLLEGVVRLSVVPLGGAPDIGAGIVIGVEGSTAYVLTALHVLVGPENVRNNSGWERRSDEISIQVEFYGNVGPLRGRLLGQWNEERDLAVVVVESPQIAERGIAVSYGLGSPKTLAAPYAALAIGHGGRVDWGRQPTRVTSVSNSLVQFRGAGVVQGFSGGAILDTTRNLLVGLITAVSDKGGEAVSMDLVVSELNSWRIPHHLRRSQVSTPMVRVPAGPIVSARRSSSAASPGQGESFLDAFFIDKYEVTVGEFRRFVESTGYSYEPGVSTCNFAYTDRDAYPMNCVTWHDATMFATWAGKMLPTEAQWERAACGPAGHIYPWGDARPRAGDSALNMDWPVPVGSHPRDRSIYGAMDLLGNVSEWVGDWYHRSRAQFLIGRNPKGPPSGYDRVIRGPSYDTPPEKSNLTLRKRDLPESGRKRFDYGFRCVLNEVGKEE
jgi:formylglycine-generating enzyme